MLAAFNRDTDPKYSLPQLHCTAPVVVALLLLQRGQIVVVILVSKIKYYDFILNFA